MKNLDIQTALLFIGFLSLILPVVCLIILKGLRNQQVILWCSGGFLSAISLIFIGLKDTVSEWFWLSFPTLVFLFSHVTRIKSLQLDLGIAWRKRWMLLAIIVIFLIFEYLHYDLQNYKLRAQFIFTVNAVFLGYLASLAWRISCREQSPNAKWIAWVYYLLTLVMLMRVGFLQINVSLQTVNIANEGVISKILTFTFFLTSVISHFGYIGLALDRSRQRELISVMERARAEENQRLSEQIAHLDRQRSVGQMAATLGHELNQPLTAILTNAQVAQFSMQTGRANAEQISTFLNKIVDNTKRASQIIERIRDYIRPSATRFELVDLKQIAHEVIELVAHDIHKQQIIIQINDSPQSVFVLGDPIQLSQIVLNIICNAIQALMQTLRREIHLSCYCENAQAILRIRDTGPGFDSEVISKVGTAFFTNKSDGLGLGLSISSSIAAQHGGKLTFWNAEKEDGGGAIFQLNLPVYMDKT